MIVVLFQFALEVRLDGMLDHVLEKQPVFCHSLERFDQVRLESEVVSDSLRDIGKELGASFVHEPRLLGHVLEVHGVVEEVLLEREKERAEFYGTLATSLKLRKNYPKDKENNTEGWMSERKSSL